MEIIKTTSNLISTPNITGNIGSCETKTTQLNKTFWYKQEMATNSCSGEIVANNTYFDYGMILILIVGTIGLTIIGGLFLKDVKEGNL